MEKNYKLERVDIYRDCIKRTSDKTRIIQYTTYGKELKTDQR